MGWTGLNIFPHSHILLIQHINLISALVLKNRFAFFLNDFKYLMASLPLCSGCGHNVGPLQTTDQWQIRPERFGIFMLI